MGVFWDPDAPLITDVGDALLSLATQLQGTHGRISKRLDERLENYEDAMASIDLGYHPDACELCHEVPKSKQPNDPLDESAARMWQFTLRELSSLLTKIQALGLAERQVKFQENTAAMVTKIFASALEAAGVPEESAVVVRGEVLRALEALEK